MSASDVKNNVYDAVFDETFIVFVHGANVELASNELNDEKVRSQGHFEAVYRVELLSPHFAVIPSTRAPPSLRMSLACRGSSAFRSLTTCFRVMSAGDCGGACHQNRVLGP